MDFPRSPKEAETMIRESEDCFTRSLRQTAKWALEENASLLTVSGPTCSGKTTTAARLWKELKQTGRTVVPFSFDDFFCDRPRDNVITASPPDYDTVQALDLSCLADALENLRKGKEARIPVYDFVSGRRAGYRIHSPVPGELYLWEGIQAVYPEVLTLLGRSVPDIVLDVEPPAEWNMTGADIRLCRRILRDVRCRGASPAFTLFLWQSVRENELRNIEPHMHTAGIRIGSCMAYEPYILADFLLPILTEIRQESTGKADWLAEALTRFRNAHVKPAMIPKDSIFREFIGP